MGFVEVIRKKRDGETLTESEIQDFVRALTRKEVPEYQAAAFLMAVYFQGMQAQETVVLTQAMSQSGKHFDLTTVPGFKIDKHSTGGIGDKVSIILAPLAAACGLIVPMMAGRGLGHSGGTIDKLESVKGYKAQLTYSDFLRALSEHGCAIISQSESIAPADKILYSLRDVTGTVECVPLIVSSILSKKIAEGTQGLVLDVKVGTGAFMKTLSQARTLAKGLVTVGKRLGIAVQATISNMDQPLGSAVGNALEMYESIRILQNKKFELTELPSTDLKELTLHLCAQMLVLAKTSKNIAEGRKLAAKKLLDGSAYEKFLQLMAFQGATGGEIKDPTRLPLAETQRQWKAPETGYVARMDCEAIGNLVVAMGGGRQKTTDSVLPEVGLVFHKKLGSKVKRDEPIATAYLPRSNGRQYDYEELEARFSRAIEIQAVRKAVPTLIADKEIS